MEKAYGFALASLILGAVSFVTLGLAFITQAAGIVTGIIALNENRKSPQKGTKALAVWGIVLSCVMLVPFVIMMVITVRFMAANPGIFSFDQCIAQPNNFVSCSAPHSAGYNSTTKEVYVGIIDNASYPLKITGASGIVTDTNAIFCEPSGWKLLDGKGIVQTDGIIDAGKNYSLAIVCKFTPRGQIDQKFRVNYTQANGQEYGFTDIFVSASAGLG